jgi:hypothetical protein
MSQVIVDLRLWMALGTQSGPSAGERTRAGACARMMSSPLFQPRSHTPSHVGCGDHAGRAAGRDYLDGTSSTPRASPPRSSAARSTVTTCRQTRDVDTQVWSDDLGADPDLHVVVDVAVDVDDQRHILLSICTIRSRERPLANVPGLAARSTVHARQLQHIPSPNSGRLCSGVGDRHRSFARRLRRC